MAWSHPFLGLPLLLLLLPLLWVPTGTGAPHVSITVLQDNQMQGYRKTRLRCDDNLILKPKQYVWSTTSGFLPPSAESTRNWLQFKSSKEPIDTTIICTVSNKQGTFKGKKSIKLPGRRFYKPIPDVVDSADSGFSSGQTDSDPESDQLYQIVLYVVVGLVVVVLGLLLCFWCYRKCC